MTIMAASFKADSRSHNYFPFGKFGAGRDRFYPVVTADIERGDLSPLAKFLADNISLFIHHNGGMTVRVWNGKTQADHESDENIIHAYDLESRAAVIDDWEFPRIAIGENATSYMNRCADEMISRGAEMITVNIPMREGQTFFI